MKVKEWLRLFGFKPQIKTYGTVTKPISEKGYTHLKWSEWQHPAARKAQPRFDDVEILKRWIRPGDLVIDVGAHVGDTTLPYAHLVGKEGVCLALEPNPYAYQALQENAEINRDYLNIVPLQAAAGEKEETLKFSYSDPGLCNGGNSECYTALERRSFYEIEVPAISLERYLSTHYAEKLSRLSFVKTDVEGHDFFLFQIHKPLIEKWRPVLQVEVHKTLSPEDKKAFAQAIQEMDYTLYCVPDVNLSSMRPLKEEDFAARKTFDLFATPN